MVWLNTLADSCGKLHIRHHDRDTLGVLGAQLGVDEQVDEIVFSSLLEGLDGESLETDVGLVVVLDQLTDELGEGELTDQEVGGLLILLNFPGGDGSLL